MSENLVAEERLKSTQNGVQNDVEQRTATDPPSANQHNILDGSASGHEDVPTKRKKTRRGKPKRRYSAKPYTKTSWQQRKMYFDMKRRKIRARGQALAPYNSNQFLIEDHDHGYFKDIEDRLQTRIKSRSDQPRTRDSSFSVDSDMDYYSSPEDEEEFLTKEFSNTYQDIRTERLNSMSKEELLQECIQMENRLEMLTKCLNKDSSDTSESCKSMSDIQLEIMKLMNDNDNLRRENERLKKTRQRSRKRGSVSSSMSSSVDSESDSSSGSSSTDSDSSLNEQDKGNEVIDYSVTNGCGSEDAAEDTFDDTGGGEGEPQEEPTSGQDV